MEKQLPIASDILDSGSATPEQRLLGAVLSRAVLDVTGNLAVNDATTKNRRTAYRWIFAAPTYEPITFHYACEYLGLDPEALRANIKRMIHAPPDLLPPITTVLARAITPLSDLR